MVLQKSTAEACNETDALLQVKFNITEEEWDSSRPPYSSFRDGAFLRLQGNEVQHYENFADVRNYAACLPKDQCSEVVVAGLPKDAYEVSFDGKSVDIGHEFFFDGNPVTSTKVGANCTKPPICEDTETLLEIQYWSRIFESFKAYSFRVEDKEGGTVLSGKPRMYSLEQSYVCLPKDDACYTFLVGGMDHLSAYSVIFDGKLVRSSDGWLFDSVRFGGSCEPLCNQDDESVIEFFLYDSNDWPGVGYEYKWDLNISNPSSSETVSSGVVPMGLGVSPLVHKIMCVPKSSCSSFYISAPNVNREAVYQVPAENTTNTTDWNDIVWVNVTRNETRSLRPAYSLTMDNVSYRKIRWTSPEIRGFGSDNQTTNMGSCTVEGLCDVQTQDLFDLELHRSATLEKWRLVTWNFGYTEYETADEWQLQYLLRDSDYNDGAYDLGSSYGAIECVPKDGCDLSFNMTPGSPVDSYTVKKNGIQLDHSIEEGVLYGYKLMTPFGQNCSPPSNSLSGDAIAGIVVGSGHITFVYLPWVGCVVAVGAIVFGLVWYKRRQAPSSEEEVAEDPLRESLL